MAVVVGLGADGSRQVFNALIGVFIAQPGHDGKNYYQITKIIYNLFLFMRYKCRIQ